MRISDWSSDVCSSDLRLALPLVRDVGAGGPLGPASTDAFAGVLATVFEPLVGLVGVSSVAVTSRALRPNFGSSGPPCSALRALASAAALRAWADRKSTRLNSRH